MLLNIIHQNLFEGEEDGIILTVDGAARGMEGNLARAFARIYPDVWEELEYDIEYPIPLGMSRVYEIHPDLDCKNSYCFIASTLNHLDTLADDEKLQVQASALRAVLSLAESRGIKSVATGVLVGGWRLELENALEQMMSTYLRARSLSIGTPALNIYLLEHSKFQQASRHLKKQYPHSLFDGESIRVIE